MLAAPAAILWSVVLLLCVLASIPAILRHDARYPLRPRAEDGASTTAPAAGGTTPTRAGGSSGVELTAGGPHPPPQQHGTRTREVSIDGIAGEESLPVESEAGDGARPPTRSAPPTAAAGGGNGLKGEGGGAKDEEEEKKKEKKEEEEESGGRRSSLLGLRWLAHGPLWPRAMSAIGTLIRVTNSHTSNKVFSNPYTAGGEGAGVERATKVESSWKHKPAFPLL